MPGRPRSYCVVYLAPIDWSFRKQDHQFVCTELAARGHRVLFVENTGARWPTLRDARRVISRLRNVVSGSMPAEIPAGIELVAPLVSPGGETRLERALNLALIRRQIAPALRRMGGDPLVLWSGLPTWMSLDLATALRPELLVYYCGDAFREVPGVRPGLARSEAALVRTADLVFANSGNLVDYCRSLGAPNTIFVPLGVDLSVSRRHRNGAPVPVELRGLRGRIIGYMGGLNHKVDLSLLEAVAATFTNDTLVVLGSVEDPAYRPRADNVLILGERPYEEIGPYLMHFGVCLIPYVVNEFTQSVYPGKLIEYLAHGRPVVSTPLREVLPYSDVVAVASNAAAFVAAVEQALVSGDDPDIRVRRYAAVERNAYEAVLSTMIEAVDERVA